MKNTHNIEIIKESESFRATPYKCPAGVWTRGYGTTLKFISNPIVEKDKSVTKDQADIEMRMHLEAYVYPIINKYVTVPLNINQYDALADFVYNVGETKFRGSTLLKKLNKKQYSLASEEFSRWVYAKKERLKGLEIRRAREKALFIKPTEIQASKPSFIQYILDYFK